ncbi:uncharacterized protein PHALS_02959 [Plasmopara halstedii]|uniref:Uncharacterized protein n=1 Tax=Plasmopara halstedii TaxID=4781 RepID=A0A0P1AW12_PLAHL|nr:uncharacterized protein PHALS_02959 [Plasmopara halstedii]CEG46561.1 hypothetical protein PHALS_02959 [Plasmopara halstedii]|eukprot:XP_024582930.1 hypothetical protein PHALS_02959 [Plasmopara halstedii]
MQFQSGETSTRSSQSTSTLGKQQYMTKAEAKQKAWNGQNGFGSTYYSTISKIEN